MRIIDYTPNSIVDGTGVRQVFWLAGCPHHCNGCHNPITWNPMGGETYTVPEVVDIAMNSPFDVTFSGGEPFFQYIELLDACSYLHRRGKNIWVYTGYTYEELVKDTYCLSILANIDVLVDGEFVKELANPKLRFKGSSNQRIIDVQKSLANKEVVLMEV